MLVAPLVEGIRRDNLVAAASAKLLGYLLVVVVEALEFGSSHSSRKHVFVVLVTTPLFEHANVLACRR